MLPPAGRPSRAGSMTLAPASRCCTGQLVGSLPGSLHRFRGCHAHAKRAFSRNTGVVPIPACVLPCAVAPHFTTDGHNGSFECAPRVASVYVSVDEIPALCALAVNQIED